MDLKNKINGIKEIWQFDNRFQLLINRLFFANEKINIYRYKNFEILIDHSAGDANGAREILTSDMYRKFLPEIKVNGEINVLDLGANNGGFPLLLRSENLRLAKVVCVEFNPQTFSRMRFNLDRNLDCEVHTLNAALTGENKILEMGFGKTSTSDSIYQSNGSTEKLRIQGFTFDEIFEKYFENEIVHICKIDVEGAEFEVFKHNKVQALKNCQYLLIEIHHENKSPRELVRQKIFELGFDEIDGDSKNDEFHHVHFFINKGLN
jgi:FkbM family methyltransferase